MIAIAVDASPLARVAMATIQSWIDSKPNPPNSSGTNADEIPLANKSSKFWRHISLSTSAALARPAKVSTNDSAAPTTDTPGAVRGVSSKLMGNHTSNFQSWIWKPLTESAGLKGPLQGAKTQHLNLVEPEPGPSSDSPCYQCNTNKRRSLTSHGIPRDQSRALGVAA